MAIRLETSKRQGVVNHQDSEISIFQLNWSKDLAKTHPHATRRTDPSTLYNCHGLTFACRRTRIETSAGLQQILDDDTYKEVTMNDVFPGDIVIYYSDAGDPNHSGIVTQSGAGLLVPLVCSKWGNAGEFVHALKDCPSVYGPITRFFRCRL